jgi:hypothetical protein
MRPRGGPQQVSSLDPDFVIPNTKVCIEIDPENTHSDRVDQDRRRNELLAEAGWRVVRLRLGGLGAIGQWDVVSDSGGLTVAAVPALVDAIADAVAGRPGRVRTVKRKSAAPRKSSRLGAIREDEYQFGVHNVGWKLNDEVLELAIVDGRYLGRRRKSEFPRFIRHLDLQGKPKDQWRPFLEPLFEAMEASDFEPASTFQWGDSLFVGLQAGKIHLHEKFNPFGAGERLTTNLDGVVEYDEAIIQSADGSVLAELHAEAISMGWQISEMQALTGKYGDYLEVILIRKSFEA